MSENAKDKTGQRSSKGSGFVLMAMSILIAVLTVGALGLDVAHNTNARTSLSDATDAAALAGAAAIVHNSINPSHSFGGSNTNWHSPNLQYNNGSIQTAVQAAVVASGQQNYSDGHIVASTAGVTLTSPSPATNFYISNNYGAQDMPDNNGQCFVNATEVIKNLFAGIFGHNTDPVTTQSLASAYTTVTGVNPNVAFPIAVSIDTIVGHGGKNGNFPLNSNQTRVSNPNALQTASQITFTLEDPCANASWTTFNTLKADGGPLVEGKSGSELDQKAIKYINDALLPSVFGTAFNLFNPLSPGGSGPPAQFVGEPSSTGGAAYTANSGIDLWGALSGAGTNVVQSMEGKTLILPVVGGDQPFWNLDADNNGTTYAPGARQTRPLLGFVAIKVNKVVWDSSNNCLRGFKGHLVKALIKGTPGLVDPMVDPTTKNGVAKNAAIMAALANLSPGMIHLGNTSFNISPTKIGNGTQVALDSWYEGHVAPGNNTVMEASLDPANEKIKPINSAFTQKMSKDMMDLCGGATYNETINWIGYQNPPFDATGVGMLKYAINGDGTLDTVYDTNDNTTALPFTQLMLNPMSQLIKISGKYSDEHTADTDIGLNHIGSTGKGYDINNDWKYQGQDDKVGPRYIVLDENGNVMQQPGYSSNFADPGTWPPLTIGPDTGKGQGHMFDVSLTINPSSLNSGIGEYLVVLHAFDTDLGHGGWNKGSYYGPGTPPGGINGKGNLWYGDPAFYYLDIQFPQCPEL